MIGNRIKFLHRQLVQQTLDLAFHQLWRFSLSLEGFPVPTVSGELQWSHRFKVGLVILQNDSCNLALGSIAKPVALVPLPSPSLATHAFTCPSRPPVLPVRVKDIWHANGSATDRSCTRARSESIFTAGIGGKIALLSPWC